MPRARINGLHHYFRLEGHAGRPVLVLVHSLGADHSLWDALVAELPQWRVLRYDLRGHGGTDVPDGACTLADLAGDLLAMTSAVGVQRFAIAGVSLGAMVAVQAAAVAPDRLQSLVLCSTAVRLPGPPGGGWDARARHALTHGMAPLAPAMMERMFAPSWLAHGEPLAGTVEQVFRSTDPAGYAAGCGVLRDADVTQVLRKVRAPALVVRGSHDALISADAARVLVQALPLARAVELDCGHYPMVEQPERLAQLMIAATS